MEINKVRQMFSFIGDFTDFLINNQQRIKNLMLDYEIQTKVDTLPDNREIKSLLFTKKNVSIMFTPGRIDYSYTISNNDISLNDILNEANEFFKLFSEIFYDLKASRVAAVGQAFVKNENDVAVSKLTSKMGLSNVFGEANEIHLKLNNPKNLFERVNSVLDLSMGQAKNNQTSESMQVLLVAIDINTIVNNKEPRFEIKNFESYFSELVAEEEEKYALLSEF